MIYGTRGYQAPEIARTGPTVASDVYTVGRTLAVLVMDVPQENGRFVEQLPGPETMPVFAKHESLYRAILRATDPDPERRFASMDELADQLTGVLHEIAAADSGNPRAAACRRTSARSAPSTAPGWDVPLDRRRGDRGAGGAEGRRRPTPAQRCSPRRAAHRPPNSSRRSQLARRRREPPQQ